MNNAQVFTISVGIGIVISTYCIIKQIAPAKTILKMWNCFTMWIIVISVLDDLSNK